MRSSVNHAGQSLYQLTLDLSSSVSILHFHQQCLRALTVEYPHRYLGLMAICLGAFLGVCDDIVLWFKLVFCT